MNFKIANAKVKSKTPVSSIVLYTFSAISAIVTVVSLSNNVRLYNKAVTYYVAQGSTKAQVTNQLLTSQLMPAIFDSIVAYGGVALILFGAGLINTKVSKCLSMLASAETCNDIIEDPVVDDASEKQEEVIE